MKTVKKINVLNGQTTHGDVKNQINDAIDTINANFEEGGASGANLTGYAAVASEGQLPSNPSSIERTLGYLIGTDLYVYVGTGGTTSDGKYKNCGPFRGPKGDAGAALKFSDLTAEEKEELKGEPGTPGKKGDKGDRGDDAVRLQGDVPLAHAFEDTPEDEKKAASAAGVARAINVYKGYQEIDSDLEITDENDNIIAEFKGGHIRTKNFDSKKIKETIVYSAKNESNADLEITDENDNIIAEFKGGHIRTKNFDSKKIGSGPLQNPLRGKIISILSDSISTFGTPDQSNAKGTWTYKGNRCRYPQSNLLTDVNQMYWKIVIDNNDMLLGINESWAGSKVSNTYSSDSGDVGPNRCISSLKRINHLRENGEPDYIIVYAGTNDAGTNADLGSLDLTNPCNYTDEQIRSLDVTTFYGAFRAMIIRLQKYYPDSKILVLFPNFTASYYAISNLDSFVEAERDICDLFGVPYLDLRTVGITIYNSKRYLPDGIHPNADAMRLIAKRIEITLKEI